MNPYCALTLGIVCAGIGGELFVRGTVGLAHWARVSPGLVGATGIALSFEIEAFVIGATVVAVGTSVPELATTVTATLRRHDEVALGTILGSNIFNGLLIVAVALPPCSRR
jgi:cation:H+ antiporter